MNAQNNNKPKRDRIGMILYVLYLLMIVGSAFIVFKLVRIQLFYKPHEEIVRAFTPSSKQKKIEPKRGDILDCNGRLLAVSSPSYQFYMDCTVLKSSYATKPEKEKAWKDKAYELSKGLAKEFPGTSADKFYKTITDGRNNNLKYVKIGTEVDYAAYKRICSLPLFNEDPNKGGRIVEYTNKRQYPYGTLARRTIGFVRDNKTKVKNTHIGLEGKFDYVLHGEEGSEYLRRSDLGRVRNNDSSYVAAVDGKDIRTTINIDYQQIADKSLRELITEEEAINSASLVLMETKTGAIRAMVNLVRDAKSREFNEGENIAVTRSIEPGSVFKTVTLMSVLNDGYIKSLEETLPATDGKIPGTKIVDSHIRDFAREHNTNKISVLEGFKISSNYVFGTLAVKNYGISGGVNNSDKFVSNIYTYKLGETFDFDLDGMASPQVTKTNLNSTVATMGYGYSTHETPLHMLTFYNAIANKGVMMKPYLVESIEKDGKVIEKRGPSVLNAAVCSPAVADTLTRALREVVQDGTGRRLKTAKLSVAGKTGTSYGYFEGQGYEDKEGRIKYQGTFAGFFPAEDPKYSVICIIFTEPTRKSYQGGGIPARAIKNLVDELYKIDPYFRETTAK